MAYECNFTVAQLSESTIQLIDTSTGSDASIYERRIYLYKYNNSTLVTEGTTTAYMLWPLGDTEITLNDVLDTDYCLNIQVDVLSSAPDPSGVYTKTQAYCFKDYNEEFMMGLVAETNVALPTIVNANSYIYNWMQMRLFVDGAKQIIDNASDVMNGQILLNYANNMRTNQNYYF